LVVPFVIVGFCCRSDPAAELQHIGIAHGSDEGTVSDEKMRLLYHRHLDASSDFLTDSNLFLFRQPGNGASFHGNLRICFQLRHSLGELRGAAAGDNEANGTDWSELIHDVQKVVS